MIRTLGDRRLNVRLEIIGALWATLEITERTRVLNISRGGALISSPVPLPAESVQPVHVTLEGHDVIVNARIRHLRRVTAADETPEYVIGMEFLAALDGLTLEGEVPCAGARTRDNCKDVLGSADFLENPEKV